MDTDEEHNQMMTIQLMELTGLSYDEAHRLLEVHQWDVGQALEFNSLNPFPTSPKPTQDERSENFVEENEKFGGADETVVTSAVKEEDDFNLNREHYLENVQTTTNATFGEAHRALVDNDWCLEKAIESVLRNKKEAKQTSKAAATPSSSSLRSQSATSRIPGPKQSSTNKTSSSVNRSSATSAGTSRKPDVKTSSVDNKSQAKSTAAAATATATTESYTTPTQSLPRPLDPLIRKNSKKASQKESSLKGGGSDEKSRIPVKHPSFSPYAGSMGGMGSTDSAAVKKTGTMNDREARGNIDEEPDLESLLELFGALHGEDSIGVAQFLVHELSALRDSHRISGARFKELLAALVETGDTQDLMIAVNAMSDTDTSNELSMDTAEKTRAYRADSDGDNNNDDADVDFDFSKSERRTGPLELESLLDQLMIAEQQSSQFKSRNNPITNDFNPVGYTANAQFRKFLEETKNAGNFEDFMGKLDGSIPESAFDEADTRVVGRKLVDLTYSPENQKLAAASAADDSSLGPVPLTRQLSARSELRRDQDWEYEECLRADREAEFQKQLQEIARREKLEKRYRYYCQLRDKYSNLIPSLANPLSASTSTTSTTKSSPITTGEGAMVRLKIMLPAPSLKPNVEIRCPATTLMTDLCEIISVLMLQSWSQEYQQENGVASPSETNPTNYSAEEATELCGIGFTVYLTFPRTRIATVASNPADCFSAGETLLDVGLGRGGAVVVAETDFFSLKP